MRAQKKGVSELTRKKKAVFQIVLIICGIMMLCYGLSLALALKGLQRFYPKKFELHAFTVSLGFDGFDASDVAALMADYQIPYTVIPTDIGEIVFEIRKEKNPCALCAKLRKGSFNEAAKQLGCNKAVSYTHLYYLQVVWDVLAAS